jgi:hypothetical protein
VFDFVGRLEAFPFPLWIEELQLEPVGENGQILQCELNMAVFAARKKDSD